MHREGIPAMPLAESLKKQNTHAIEELFNYRLLYDLKLAAFVRGYHLLTYYSDVDHDGFDVVLDDRDYVRKIQLKTVARDACTQSWDIHRSIIRPIAPNFEALGFNFDVNNPNWGVEGGVVLIDYEPQGEAIDVRYYFTDIYVITAISLGLLPHRHGATVGAANALRADLFNGESSAEIGVAKGLFIQAETPQHLLALIGLHSEHYNGWRHCVEALASEEWGPKGKTLPKVLEGFRNGGILDRLKQVSGQPDP
jgi:hypothetical protein